MFRILCNAISRATVYYLPLDTSFLPEEQNNPLYIYIYKRVAFLEFVIYTSLEIVPLFLQNYIFVYTAYKAFFSTIDLTLGLTSNTLNCSYQRKDPKQENIMVCTM
jgi:hypothetical protein